MVRGSVNHFLRQHLSYSFAHIHTDRSLRPRGEVIIMTQHQTRLQVVAYQTLDCIFFKQSGQLIKRIQLQSHVQFYETSIVENGAFKFSTSITFISLLRVMSLAKTLSNVKDQTLKVRD